jgi:hypothetical protein
VAAPEHDEEPKGRVGALQIPVADVEHLGRLGMETICSEERECEEQHVLEARGRPIISESLFRERVQVRTLPKSKPKGLE